MGLHMGRTVGGMVGEIVDGMVGGNICGNVGGMVHRPSGSVELLRDPNTKGILLSRILNLPCARETPGRPRQLIRRQCPLTILSRHPVPSLIQHT
jgi:hypothetical protein